jgi:hypothetical protein
MLYRCTRNFVFNGRKVHVSNLPRSMDQLDLQDMCSEFGAVDVGPRLHLSPLN